MGILTLILLPLFKSKQIKIWKFYADWNDNYRKISWRYFPIESHPPLNPLYFLFNIISTGTFTEICPLTFNHIFPSTSTLKLKYPSEFKIYFDLYLNPNLDLDIDHDLDLHINTDLDFDFDIYHPQLCSLSWYSPWPLNWPWHLI